MKKTSINLLFATAVSVIFLTTTNASVNESLALQGETLQSSKAQATLALFELCKTGGEVKRVEELIEQGADVHSRKTDFRYTPLHVAAENGHLDVCRVLIKNRAEVGARCPNGRTPLHLAARNGHTELSLFSSRRVPVSMPKVDLF